MAGAGGRLSYVLSLAGVGSQARYVDYFHQPGWWNSTAIAEALHPQTLVAYEMNGEDLLVPFGDPRRMKVPRQLGYKSVKHVNRVTVTDSLKNIATVWVPRLWTRVFPGIQASDPVPKKRGSRPPVRRLENPIADERCAPESLQVKSPG